MTQSNPKILFPTATTASPVTLKVSDMFTLMPYENSLVVLKMNGPQIKAVLERGYRNYYYYKYVPDYGGYSYYTTCMLDTNKVGPDHLRPEVWERGNAAASGRQQRRLVHASMGRRSTSPTPPSSTTSRRSTTSPPARATSTTAA